MNTTTIDAVRAAAAHTRAEALAIIDLCAEAGQPERAAGFIAAGTPAAAVRTALGAEPPPRSVSIRTDRNSSGASFDPAVSAARWAAQMGAEFRAMSEDADADLAIVDIADVIADPAERENLLEWGANYLSSNDEDLQIRVGALVLEFRDHVFRAARARGHRVSFWQARLGALALLTACIRRRAARESEESNAVRH